MVIAGVVIISVLLMALFLAVTIAGGRAHDRQNAEVARQSAAAMKVEPPLPATKN
ncbi:hypothetical protein BH09PSE3_BH09PSE3_15960 [soil metagenome]